MASGPVNTPSPAPRPRRRSLWLRWLAGVVALLVLAFAGGELLGWRFLGGPLERLASKRLERPIKLTDAEGKGFQLHLLGSIRLNLDELRLDNPAWAGKAPMVEARNLSARLQYPDLINALRGEPLRIAALGAEALSVQIVRQKDGRANWQFSKNPPAPRPASETFPVRVARLAVAKGQAVLRDETLRVDADAQFRVTERAGAAAPLVAAGAADLPDGARMEMQGHYRNLPLYALVETGHGLPWITDSREVAELPVTLRLVLGSAKLRFKGTVNNLLQRPALHGNYSLSGSSLAAAGEPLGVILPTTPPFSMNGAIAHKGARWETEVKAARIGRSRLAGQFVFDPASRGVPAKLSGRLTGAALFLQDLGPAIGVPQKGTPPASQPGKVIPDRAFDLPSLRAMNADVKVELDRFNFGTAVLEDIRQLVTVIRLKDGVLQIRDIDATLAKGRLRGAIELDGRESVARWNTQLRTQGLALEQWIHQSRGKGQPPYVSGRIGASLELKGRGNSTAALLGSADGQARVYWTRGQISHLAVEAVGIDIAQSLGVLVRGDDSLPVQCGAADLRISSGTVVPRLMVVDTRDSTIWLDGSASLASETLALTAHVSPKDISPLALRTPLKVEGSFSKPEFALEKAPLIKRLVPAALLALIHPLAALIPLIDVGDHEMRPELAQCQKLMTQRAGRDAM